MEYFHQTKNDNGPLLLLKNKTGEYYFFNKNSNKIEYKCWEQKNKRYKFWENKVFIFEKDAPIPSEIIQEELDSKILTQPDKTLKEFIEYVVYKYTEHDKPLKIQESEALYIGIHSLSKNTKYGAKYLANSIEKAWIKQKKYNLFIDSPNGWLIHIWLYNKISPAKNIPEGYKWKKAISLEIQEEEKTKVLVTNGTDQDIFDYE